MKRYLLFFLLACAPLAATAQTTLNGVVRDAKSNEPLTAATLQVAGTFRGTVSNSDGQFEITVPSFPTILYIRFIGYDTDTLRLESAPAGELTIRLRPSEVRRKMTVVK